MIISASPPRGQSLFLQNQSAKNLGKLGTSIERLSTGKRINHAKDDPAGLIAVEQLKGELSEIQATIKTNKYEEFSLRERASKLNTMQRGLIEIRGQVVAASGDLLSADQKQALQIDVDAALESLDRIGGDLFSTAAQQVASGAEGNLVNGDAAVAAEAIDAAQQATLHQQAVTAAEQRQLEVYDELARDQEVIVTQTISLIEDADFAEETANLATAQILTKASNAALVYSQQAHADTIGALLDRVDVDD